MNMNIRGRLRSFIDNSKHVMNISYRPSSEQFRKSAKVIIFGILLIGISGFVIGVIISFLVSGTLPAI